MLCFWDRVYINVGQDFSEGHKILDFEKLIDDVATQKRIYNGMPLLEVITKDGKDTTNIFRGRTKRFIVQETNAFISGIQEVQSEKENMASFASKRQLNRLIDAFQGKGKRISAYAVVVIYIMSRIILESPDNSNYDFTLMQEIIAWINLWVQAYNREYPDDELAVFLLDCVGRVQNAIQQRNTNLQAENFPYIPKQNPDDLFE